MTVVEPYADPWQSNLETIDLHILRGFESVGVDKRDLLRNSVVEIVAERCGTPRLCQESIGGDNH